jgi:DNA-binding NarL/FixJ family response regulator
MPQESQSRPAPRVIIASPDRRLLSLLSSTLSKDRCCELVDAVDDGEGIAGRSDFDVALVDLAISVPGFLELNSRLRAWNPAPQVVAVSNAGPVYLRHAVAAEGVADYIVISDDLADLPERIRRVGAEPPAALTATEGEAR